MASNSDQILPQYLTLGGLLLQNATPTTIAQAQAIFPGIKLPYPNFVGSIGQMLRPFPQYGGVGDSYAQFGNEHYNSLQTSLQKTMSNGLYHLVSYTWSRSIKDAGDNINTSASAANHSAYNLQAGQSVSANDTPQAISIATVYALPFGQGHVIGNSRMMNQIIGGWQLSGIQNYGDGGPLGTIGGNCLVPYTGGCYASYNPAFRGPVRINGRYGSGQPSGPNPLSYINVNAFQNATPYTFGTTPRTMAYSLRGSLSLNEQVSLGRNSRRLASRSSPAPAAGNDPDMLERVYGREPGR